MRKECEHKLISSFLFLFLMKCCAVPCRVCVCVCESQKGKKVQRARARTERGSREKNKIWIDAWVWYARKVCVLAGESVFGASASINCAFVWKQWIPNVYASFCTHNWDSAYVNVVLVSSCAFRGSSGHNLSLASFYCVYFNFKFY